VHVEQVEELGADLEPDFFRNIRILLENEVHRGEWGLPNIGDTKLTGIEAEHTASRTVSNAFGSERAVIRLSPMLVVKGWRRKQAWQAMSDWLGIFTGSK
jgi:hypothetical protein